jgi:hypothetical protein
VTRKGQEYDETFDHGGTGESGQPWTPMLASVTCLADSEVHHQMTRQGHAFYVINRNNLFVRGVPFRNNYTQFSAGLP